MDIPALDFHRIVATIPPYFPYLGRCQMLVLLFNRLSVQKQRLTCRMLCRNLSLFYRGVKYCLPERIWVRVPKRTQGEAHANLSKAPAGRPVYILGLLFRCVQLLRDFRSFHLLLKHPPVNPLRHDLGTAPPLWQ